MTQQINLNRQAAAILHQVQKQTGPVNEQVEAKIAEACEANDGKKLSADQLSQVLLQAMPAQKCTIEQAQKKCVGYHADGKNGAFLTQILNIRIEKETNVVHSQPVRTNGPWARDPYYSSFTMDPKADFLLLFNARDVDRNGRPLLMKVVARERADLSQLDLSQYRTRENQKDVDRVANDADYVEVKDMHENEFEFGDPLKQTSLDKCGSEISTTVKTRPQNTMIVNTFLPLSTNRSQPDLNRRVGSPRTQAGPDRTPVVTFRDRVRIRPDITDAFITKGGWTETHLDEDIKMTLELDRGYMFEPGAAATFEVLGNKEVVSIPDDDGQLLGSDHLDVPYAGTNLATILSHAPRQTMTVNGQGQAVNLDKGDALLDAYPDAAKIGVAGAAFVPYGKKIVENMAEAKLSATKVPTPNDPEMDAQTITLNLDAGFIAPSDGASIKGWKVTAGYTDAKGWHGSEPITIDDPDNFKAQCLTVNVDGAPELLGRNRNLEIRIFNQDNVPAQKVEIPLRSIKWANNI